MDVFTGDRQITIPDEFPPQLAPFPEPTDFFFSHPMDVIHSPEIFANSSTSPPHKLRPVRFNVRSPVSDSPENRWLFETGGEGLFSNFGCDVNRQLECLSESENVEPPKSVICGNISGQYSGMIAEERNSNSQERVQEDEYSTSSDDGSAIDIKAAVSGKRRRKSRRKVEIFIENLVMKVIEKQEQMHKQFIEIIESKERERIIREEAWMQQEIERMKRDEEIRNQEMSRSLALISTIENLLGHEILIHQPMSYQSMEENGGETDFHKDIKYDPNNERWREAEVQTLIALRTELEQKFRDTYSKGSIWEEISLRMNSMGCSRTAKKCKEKWENINKYFQRSVVGGKQQFANDEACPYFNDLDLLYKNGLGNSSGNGYSITNEENEAKSENK